MRYCLRCRRLSGEGRLCTSCGGSFGGRLCDRPTNPHLNPPDARICGQCGSTRLYEPAHSIPLSGIGTLLKAGALLGLAWLAAPPLLAWAGRMLDGSVGGSPGDLLGIGRYRDWRVWAFETLVPWLVPLFVLYWLTSLLPGRGGRQVRGLLTRFLARSLNLLFDVLQGAVKIAFRLILKLLDRDRRDRGGRNSCSGGNGSGNGVGI